MLCMTKEQADNLDFIKQILEENGFSAVCNIVRLQSGSRSLAYYVDDYIVRFPKAEIIWQIMRREKNIIDMVYPHLMPNFAGKIQKINLIEAVYPFSVSTRIYGKICDGRQESEYATLYQNLNAQQQKRLACDLALFFNQMHQIDYKKLNIPEPTEAIDDWDVTSRKNFDFEKVRQVLLSYDVDLNDYKVQAPNMTMALCHNDLSGSNILLSPEKEDVLAGIVDFGNAVVMPKYRDFFPLYKIDRQLAVATLAEYNKMTSSPIDLKQVDFMALAYTGLGLAQNESAVSPYFMKLLKPFL